MKKKTVLMMLFALCFAIITHGQAITLKGTVLDAIDKTKLIGANVRIGDTYLATSTNEKGEFVFNDLRKGNYEVIISYIGYKTHKISLSLHESQTLSIVLERQSITTEEVVITSSRANEKVPTTWTTVTAKEMKQAGIMKDIPLLLEFSPSVVSTTDAGVGVGYSGMRVRGTDITRINVTLNGVPVNDPESHEVYWVNIPDLIGSLDNIQIQRGVGTSSNGAAAFGASINLQTSKPSDSPFAELNSSYGSFNSLSNSIRFGTGSIGKNWIIDGRLSQVSSDGYIDRAYTKLNSFYINTGYYGQKTVLKFMILNGKELTYQAWGGVPKDSLKTNRTYNPYFYDNEIDNYKQQHYHLTAIHQVNQNIYLNSTLFLVKGLGYYEQYKSEAKFSKYGLQNFIIGGDTINKTDLIQQKHLDNMYYGLNLNGNYNYENIFRLQTGLSASNYTNDHFGKLIWMQYADIVPKDYKWHNNSGHKKEISYFVKAGYDVLENLTLFGDILYRNINYKIEGNHDDLRDITQSHVFNFFNPKTGLVYSISDYDNIYASVSVANREPSRNNFKDAEEGKVPKPEKLIDYELGYIKKKQNVMFQTNLYYMDYINQLVMTGEINNVGAVIMSNVAKSYRFGIESAFGLNLGRKINIQANLTLSRNKINDYTEYVDDWDTGLQQENYLGKTSISFSPEIVGSGIMEYTPYKNIHLFLNAKYVGKQYIDNSSSHERMLNPYFVSNFRIDYDLPLKLLKRTTLSFQVLNLFNEQYESNAWVYRYLYGGKEYAMDGYFPQAGRHYMCSINIQF